MRDAPVRPGAAASAPRAGLLVEVRDDGRGVVVPGAEGVGLVSMRERAEEIGGTFAIDARPGSGTTISAFLPTAARAPAEPVAEHRAAASSSRVDGLDGMTRVLVVDDHPLFRDGLAALLRSVPDTEVVGLAADGEAACRLAAELAPDVVVMDLNMPGLPGLEAIRRLTRLDPPPAVLVLTMVDDDDSVTAALQVGAGATCSRARCRRRSSRRSARLRRAAPSSARAPHSACSTAAGAGTAPT